MDLEELILVPSDRGRFEVSLDEELLHSKLETGRFPENRDIVKAVEARLHG